MKHTITFYFALLIGFAAHSQCYKTMPFTENFNSSSWTVSPTTTGIGIIDPCWTRISNPSTSYEWAVGPTIIPNNFTGAANDHTTGNGKYAFTNWTGFNTSTINARFESPYISLVGATSPELIFWYHMFGSGIGTLKAQVNAGSGWVNLQTITGQKHSSPTASWSSSTLNLSAYVGDTVRVRFLATRTSLSNLARICIDDVSVAEAPTCPAPTALYTSNTTANSTNFGWAVAPNDTFEIQYGPAGFSLGSGTIVTPTANPQTINGLAGSTTYALYVRRICSPTDQSTWAGPIYTTTSCTAPAIAPFYEYFDHEKWEPQITFPNTPGNMAPCWVDNPSTQFNYLWMVNPNGLNNFQTGPSADHTTGSGKYVGTERWGGNNNSATLTSPKIDLSTITNPEMNFWYHMYGSGIDKLEVRVKKLGSPYVTVLTITGEQQNSSADAWDDATISLAQFSNDTVLVQFRGYKTTSFSNSVMIAIDDLSIYTGPTCPKPNSLAANNITINSVDLSWTSGTGGSYEIKYGVPGFDPDVTGTSVSAPSSPHTVTGLTAGTDYDLYVRKICTGNDTSFWEGPLTLKTFCLTSAPFTQNFDGSNWVISPIFNNPGTIDDCYTRSTNTEFMWTPGPEQFSSFQTGPAADHTTGSGQFMFTNPITFSNNSVNANLITEYINLSPLDTPELSFWYHMYGNQIGTLLVHINNGSGWTQIFTKTGQQQISKTDAWKEEIIDLSSYIDDTVRLRFRGTKAGFAFNCEIAIDDIDIHERPDCQKPNNLAFNKVTFNSAEILWTTGGASNWQIKYGPSGGTQSIINAGSNPITLNNLTPNTTYDVWVRDSCGPGSVSFWVGPVTFRTQCTPTIAPYTENFDGTTFVPWTFANQPGSIDACYRRSDTVNYYWVPGPGQFSSFQTGPDSASAGSQYIYSRVGSGFNTNNSTVLRTTWIDISTLTSPELRYDYHMYGANIDKLEVYVQPYEGNQQLIKTHSGQSQTSSSAPWLQEVISLTNVTGDTVRFVFKASRTANGFRAEIALDEIEVSNPQVCSIPTALSTSNPTPTSIDVTWTSGTSASGSNIEYGTQGFTPGSGTVIYGVTSTHTVNGLNANTTYDFYVQDSCYWGTTSNWAGPVSGTTQNCPSVTASITHSISNLNVQFDGSGSTGQIDDYLWDFGDGNTDTLVSPNHAYTNAGTYNVSLIVSNYCGNADTAFLTINICDTIAAQFAFNKGGLTANFDGSSSLGTNLSFVWLYGDGNNGTGGATSHTYATDGTYNVSLIVTDGCGQTDTMTQSITVCSPLQAQINYVQNGLQVDFDASSITGATTWFWNFGDGNTDTTAAPTHVFAVTGTFQITLYVSNLCGETDTATLILTLCNTPKAAWTYQILSSGGNGMTVQFDGTASIGANTFMWDFGDGNTNNVTAIPVHTYTVPGLFYVVQLTVANNCGDEDVLSGSLATIGLTDFDFAEAKVFPNPVDDQLTLVLPNYLRIDHIKIYNDSGQQMVVNSSVDHGVVTLLTSDLASGNYIVEISTDAGTGTYKVIVQH